jgi:hypothetical protein
MPPVPEADIRLAIASGLSMVCATCAKWQAAHEKGLEKCLAQDGCGSPIVGDTFHEYDGPITDFLRFCFVCGNPATKGIRVHGHVRLIGACDKHVEYVAQLAPTAPPPERDLLRTILSPEGEGLAEKLLIPKPKRTLAQALVEMEKGTFKPDG